MVISWRPLRHNGPLFRVYSTPVAGFEIVYSVSNSNPWYGDLIRSERRDRILRGVPLCPMRCRDGRADPIGLRDPSGLSQLSFLLNNLRLGQVSHLPHSATRCARVRPYVLIRYQLSSSWCHGEEGELLDDADAISAIEAVDAQREPGCSDDVAFAGGIIPCCNVWSPAQTESRGRIAHGLTVAALSLNIFGAGRNRRVFKFDNLEPHCAEKFA